MWPLKVGRSRIPAQSRGSVKVLVQPENGSLLAIAIALRSSRCVGRGPGRAVRPGGGRAFRDDPGGSSGQHLMAFPLSTLTHSGCQDGCGPRDIRRPIRRWFEECLGRHGLPRRGTPRLDRWGKGRRCGCRERRSNGRRS